MLLTVQSLFKEVDYIIQDGMSQVWTWIVLHSEIKSLLIKPNWTVEFNSMEFIQNLTSKIHLVNIMDNISEDSLRLHLLEIINSMLLLMIAHNSISKPLKLKNLLDLIQLQQPVVGIHIETIGMNYWTTNTPSKQFLNLYLCKRENIIMWKLIILMVDQVDILHYQWK